MPSGVLADVQPHQMNAEATCPAERVEQRTVGDLRHAAGDERVPAQHQRRQQFPVREDHLRPRRTARRRPCAGCFESVAQRVQHRAVGLRSVVRRSADGIVADRHGKRRGQPRHVPKEEIGRLAAGQHQHLPGHRRRHVRIAVPVAAHPGRERERHHVHGQRRAVGAVQFAHGLGQGQPERVLDDGETPPRLLARRRSLVPDLVGVPCLQDQPFEFGVEPGTGVAGGAGAGFENRGDVVVLLDQRSTQHLGGMRGQHEFDAHWPEGIGVHGIRPSRIPGRLALIRDIGQIEELVERPRDIGEHVLRQCRERGAEAFPVRARSAPGAFGQCANGLDAVHERAAPVVGDHPAEQRTEQAHVTAQGPG